MIKYQIEWSYWNQNSWYNSATFVNEDDARRELLKIKSSKLLTDDMNWRLVEVTERVIG